MATDTARVHLELASGKNEITAPFHETARRRRKHNQLDAASVGALAIHSASSGARPSWIAFGVALVAVAVAVWWVMAQRMPDIDPREVITRNLSAAQTAIAEGRYTDPPERSAFHYYSTVLALDPDNVDALAGVDAIADRHLADARVLLADAKIAEAGVALEKARRVRPDHNGLAVVDAQWRGELLKLLAASTTIPRTVAEPVVTPAKPAKPANAKQPAAAARPAAVRVEQTSASAPKPQRSRNSSTGSASVNNEPASPARMADLGAVAAALAAMTPSTQLEAIALPSPESEVSAPSTGANIADENAPVPESAPGAGPAVEPKLIKMVQPQYPQEALMRGIEGWVELSLQVSPTGDVIDPRVEDSSRGRVFNRAALSAVQQWKYEPRTDGTTSERVRVRVRFQQAD